MSPSTKAILFGELVEFRQGQEPLASLWLPHSLAQQVASAPGAYLRTPTPLT